MTSLYLSRELGDLRKPLLERAERAEEYLADNSGLSPSFIAAEGQIARRCRAAAACFEEKEESHVQ